jgi:hypothetical protein
MVLCKGKASSRKSVFVLETTSNRRVLVAVPARLPEEWILLAQLTVKVWVHED